MFNNIFKKNSNASHSSNIPATYPVTPVLGAQVAYHVGNYGKSQGVITEVLDNGNIMVDVDGQLGEYTYTGKFLDRPNVMHKVGQENLILGEIVIL